MESPSFSHRNSPKEISSEYRELRQTPAGKEFDQDARNEDDRERRKHSSKTPEPQRKPGVGSS